MGADPKRENHPDHVLEALDNGYHAEIDVWFIDEKFYLGHDRPQYEVDISFLKDARLWCHAKNIEALEKMSDDNSIHCFWHQDDDVTLTSLGYLWTYPGCKITSRSICVMPESELANYNKDEINIAAGVCSDLLIDLLSV